MQARFFRRAFLEAVKRSDLDLMQRLRLRLVFAVPAVREGLQAHFADLTGDVASPDWETLIGLIIEALPEIIALIELIIGLFE